MEFKNIEELTDKGNAKRFARLTNGQLVYVVEDKAWYRWDKGVWAVDRGAGVMATVDVVRTELDAERRVFQEELARLMTKYDGDIKEPEVVQCKYMLQETQKQHLYLGNKRSHEDLLHFAARTEVIQASINDFDSKGLYFGVLNGVYDVKRGVMVCDDPSYMVSKRVHTEYNKDAVCPQWEAQLELVCQGDKDLIAYLQRVAGQMLLGVSKGTMIIFTGVGANGKSTYTKALQMLLGDYAVRTDARTIINDGQNKEYYMAKLRGARLVTMSETSADARLANELVKNLVDSEGITGRNPRGEPFDFMPVLTPILSTNHVPMIGDDDAVWRRTHIVRWNYVIPKDKQNKTFVETVLMKEFSGILNWCIKGAEDYLLDGLNPPKAVVDAVNREKDDQDRIKTFVETYCVADVNGRVKTADLREMYAVDSLNNGTKPLGIMSFNNTLERKGYDVIKDTKIPGGPKVMLGYRFPVGFDITETVRRDKDLLVTLKEKVLLEAATVKKPKLNVVL